MTQQLPLRGLKVLDISQGIAGPNCAMMLALQGAEVVKVEPPRGDWMRTIGVRYGKQSAHSAAYNRGKKSIVLDLKNPVALAATRRLAAEADVFVENFRPGAVNRLGLGYDEVAADNPGLVYVSISGFGQHGPYSDRPCTDTVAQAFSGMMTVNRAMDDSPVKMGAFFIDAFTGLYAFQAVSMALYGRRDSGAGQYLDISLMQSVAAMLTPNIMEQYVQNGPPRLPNVPGGVYQTKDGWMLATLLREQQYRDLCAVLGLPELAQDPRFDDFDKRDANKAALLPLLQAAFLDDTTANWEARLREVDVLCGPVNSILDWLGDPHVQAVNAAPMFSQPDLGAVPLPTIPGVSPASEGDPLHKLPDVGEHTRAVLEDLGLDAADVEALVKEAATVA
ncbi:MAG: CoA transferase [Alphaproteobacteria bacterium]|nr:CoA transferase [Alphaproteobacteria bacterium]